MKMEAEVRVVQPSVQDSQRLPAHAGSWGRSMEEILPHSLDRTNPADP
jgi:hypothetical protein